MLTYLVGGAVRDDLLGRPVTDRDWVVVGATPEDMIARGFRQVGADFPVFLHPDSNEEYALARTERKQGHGYHGFVVHAEPDVTLEQDLQRRDLTINAMARDESGYIVDPFNGQTDLHNRQLRHVSPAFAEDPLRILRVARFAARFAPLGFTVAPETLALMAGMARDGEVDHLVPERIWQEMQRALLEAEPVVFFRVLHGCGALDRLIPSLSRMMTREESPLPLRALMAACDLSDSVPVRYGALIAGLNDTRDADALSERLRAPNDCRAIASLLSVTVDDLLGEASTDSSLLLAVFDRCDAWRRPERFADVLTGAEALARARNVPFQRSPIETALQTAKAVDPQMLMAQGHKGKALGEAIRRTRHERIAESLARPGRAAR